MEWPLVEYMNLTTGHLIKGFEKQHMADLKRTFNERLIPSTPFLVLSLAHCWMIILNPGVHRRDVGETPAPAGAES